MANDLFLASLLISSMAHLSICGRPHAVNRCRDLVTTTCNQTLYFDVCMSSLGSDPRSCHADLTGLATMGLNLSMAHASATITRITQLMDQLNEMDDTYVTSCLSDCLDQYSDAVDNLLQSIDALAQKSYDEVNELVSAAMMDSDSCEEGFVDKPGYVSPLSERNEFFSKLCSISLSITKLLA